MIEVRKKEGETPGSFLFRFGKRVKQSGVLKEVRKRKHRGRSQNRAKRRASALYREKRAQEFKRAKKYGSEPSRKTS